ncbi:MAG: hypothetical protein ACTSWL_04355 [Promethearchaeota archaeon]
MPPEKKKHCDKHYRYVATCPDCRKANQDYDDTSKAKNLYRDAEFEDLKNNSNHRYHNPDIPKFDEETREPKKESNRYHYVRKISPKSRKRWIIVGIILGTLALIIGLYAIPAWLAKINLQRQLYENKSGGIDFWKIFSLNLWSTNFFFNKIGLIGAILGCIVMSIPPERKLFALIGRRLKWSTPNWKKSLIIWWTAGFALFFIIGQAMENGYFGLTMYMIQEGKIPGTFGTYFGALRALSNPSLMTPVQLFVYSNVTRPIISYILWLIVIRIILNIVVNVMNEKDHLRAYSDGAFIIAIFFFMGILARPLKAQDGLDLIYTWSIYLGVFIFLAFGIGSRVYQKKSNIHGAVMFTKTLQRKSIYAAIALIIIILIPVFVAIPKQIGLTNTNTWEDVKWNVQFQQQIAWTREAAGIEIGGQNYFTVKNIDNYPGSVTAQDSEILPVIRQYDKTYSGKMMNTRIKSTVEEMADSDIIYVPTGTGKGEYWVSPKTLNLDLITKTDVNEHTELYANVEGFISMDTSTGTIVDSADYMNIFGVEANYPIFFGEKADPTYTSESSLYDQSMQLSSMKAYDNDILLNTDWGSNNTQRFSADPDGYLSGMQGFWYTMNMGLTSYAIDNSFNKTFLINRNIHTRVESVLLPGMISDNDAYLVFDRANNKMYYALSIYTNLQIGSYAKSPLYRFLGVVLVDVKSGEMDWYQSPGNLNSASQDLFGNLWQLYMDTEIFPWQPAPSWLISQMRYSESLWESQISVDYFYHVTDSQTWIGGSNFYKRPTGSDTYYIETDLGNGIEFVGTDMVEYDQEGAEKLAGLYFIRQGVHFGQTVFYRTDPITDNMIGPATAESQLSTAAAQDLKAVNKRVGNKLMYPLAGSLYYYIPVYSIAEAGNYEDFVLAGLVNAFTQTVGYGADLQLAYADLITKLGQNQTETNETTNDLKLSVDASNNIQYDPEDWANFRVNVNYDTLNTSMPARNLGLNMSIWSDVNMSVKVFNQPITPFQFNSSYGPASNYTIRSWTGANALNPGELSSFIVQINPSENLTGAGIIIYYEFDLIDLDTLEVISTGRLIFTFLN